MTEKEVIERIHDLIHTCNVGIEKHSAYDDLFKLDKLALTTAVNLLEKKDKTINLITKTIYEKFKDVLLLEYGFESAEEFKQYCEKKVSEENE